MLYPLHDLSYVNMNVYILVFVVTGMAICDIDEQSFSYRLSWSCLPIWSYSNRYGSERSGKTCYQYFLNDFTAKAGS